MSVSRHDVWIERIARYHDGSLTVREFCNREGVSQPSFYAWKKKLAGQASPAAFVPVTLESTLPLPLATIELPGGATIELPRSIPTQDLTRVVAVVISVTKPVTAS